MSTLPDELFSLVEKSVLAAREAAEGAAHASLNTLAVNLPTPYDSMSEGARQLRRALRAKARQLGGGSQIQGLQPLVEEIAYQQWHRMLFARFLADNDLLMHPTGVPVTLQDCAELAPEEGEADVWAVAAKYASEMLPGIFRRDDPVVKVHFAPESRQELERILGEMPRIVFQADDSLGWMYQFWQSKKKEEINASERKISGAEIGPVTQLFTENYMVRFLLENTLGAWWAIQHPDSSLIPNWKYLRWMGEVEDRFEDFFDNQINGIRVPVTDTYTDWPESITDITIMDPCCGSGHFLVVAFEMLHKMRIEEEGISEKEAADAVIRDNLFGLEIDPRCTQIAVFSISLAAWKLGGYRQIPLPNIACSGIPVRGQLDDWMKLAGDNYQVKESLKQLHHLFQNAPTFGSLINPMEFPVQDRMFLSGYEEVEPILHEALNQNVEFGDPTSFIFGNSVTGLIKAANYLSKKYTLVVTNVPYLGRGKQNETLKKFCDIHYKSSKSNLAAAFVDRCKEFTKENGVYALVTHQNWLEQASYKKFRSNLLSEQYWKFVCWLGPGAFTTISGEVVKPILLIISNEKPDSYCYIMGFDISEIPAKEKPSALIKSEIEADKQFNQINNPDSRILLSNFQNVTLLREYARSVEGLSTGDAPKYIRMFWELPNIPKEWSYLQGGASKTQLYGGCSQIVFWENGVGELSRSPKARIQGHSAWNSPGILVCRMSTIRTSLYLGGLYDKSCVVIVPERKGHIDAIWHYCSSEDYVRNVRLLDKGLNIATGTLVKVPFDDNYWNNISNESFPLPEPHSNEPIQWLFQGDLVSSTDPLHIAVVRLLGYRWPEQKADSLEAYADEDGIVCLTPVVGEAPAADRLRALLQAAYGKAWSAQKQAGLLAEVGFSGKTLRAWLRDGYFKQHVKLFKNRPFIWHIWDGRSDGFHALVKYHKLDATNLDRLIYTYLGSWIKLQRDKRDLGEPGADGRLVAALELQEKLEAIREGESPYDIYVRWKSLTEQPIGWNPDLNDGVRLNIRPFVTAGVLRNKFTIHWKKDRGKNPDGSERHNDLHYTIAEKKVARGY